MNPTLYLKNVNKDLKKTKFFVLHSTEVIQNSLVSLIGRSNQHSGIQNTVAKLSCLFD